MLKVDVLKCCPRIMYSSPNVRITGFFAVCCLCLLISTGSSTISCRKCKDTAVECELFEQKSFYILSCRHHNNTWGCPQSNITVNRNPAATCFLNVKYNAESSMWLASSSAHGSSTLPPRSTCFDFWMANPVSNSPEEVAVSCFCNTSNCNAVGNYSIQRKVTPTTVLPTATASTNATTILDTIVTANVTSSDHHQHTSSSIMTPSSISSALPTTITSDHSHGTSTHSVIIQSTDSGRQDGNKSNDKVVIIIAVLILAVLVLFSALVFTVCFMYRKHVSKRTHHSILMRHIPPPVYDADLVDEQFPITILNTIGYGKFGSVYKGIYEGSPVAVKVFSSHHFNSWNTERDIYTQPSTPHSNILRFIGCEQRGYGPRKQYYMITEYFSLGSLTRFLQHNQLNWSQALNVIHSVSSGLAHLHSNNYTSQEGVVNSKFSIAHRDVKSANVLVKDTSGHCVLGDLGLALILDPTADVRKMAKCGQVGTYRYMAPEALDARVNLRDIESFKQIDVYALALVIWEVCSRCQVEEDIPVPPYQSPYFSIVGERPTIDLMKHVVVVEKTRPDIVACWRSHSGLKQVVNLTEESWDEDSEARLTAANIVSRLNVIKKVHEQENLTNNTNDSGSVNMNSTVVSTSTTDPLGSSHKKVRVSSSFSGQPIAVNTANVSQRTRFSVGTNESPHAYIQRFHRRSSLCNDGLSNVNQFLSHPRFEGMATPLTESSDSAPRHNNDLINNPVVNIDAATGQPSVAAANESSTHEEYTNVSLTTTDEHSSQ